MSAAHLRLMRNAILHSTHHMAVYDSAERLVAWSLQYEAFHKPVFDALRTEGRLDNVDFEEFVTRSLARQFSEAALPAQVASRLAAHRNADSTPRERYIPGMGWYHITKMRIPSGGVMTIGVDISEIKAKEAELVAARRAAESANAAKDVFLANMSHEFRTPLNGVLGVAALLEATPLDPKQAELLAVLQRSARALLQLVGDVLDLSMIETRGVNLWSEPFQPARTLDEVAALLGAGVDRAKVTLTTSADTGAMSVLRGDQVRFRQVLWNLLENAIKFTPAGWIEAALRTRPEGARIRLIGVVEDTGPGVPASERAEIFERFRQARGPDDGRPQGAGLGLAICRSVVEAMDGEISCEEGAAGGARFRFSVLLDPVDPTELDVCGDGA